MDKPFIEIIKDGRYLRIWVDEDALNPRKEFDNLGTIVYWSRRYKLGDERFNYEGSPDEWRKEKEGEGAIVLPVYAYDHGNVVLNTTGFSCPWDSGQCGFIYADLDSIKNCFGIQHGLDKGDSFVITPENTPTLPKEVIDKVKAALVAEIETYNQFINGDVYGFQAGVIKTCPQCGESKEEETDACWGFYGQDWKLNGLCDNLPQEFNPLKEELLKKHGS